jgi:aminopeptidase N
LWWPCKDTHADKPDEGVDIAISAPRGVSVASIGMLAGVDQGDDGFDTWRWKSRHPYAGYAIAINGGPYELIERDFTGVNGTTFPIQFWALPDNADKARLLVETDAVPDLEFFERMIGPYPWGYEKAGFVETPHLGMEHQTINGYGEQYRRGRHGFDQLLHHELAHEWFGNVMTHGRPEDSWLHEGYASYLQSVYAEETVGRMGYFDRMYSAYENNEHCLPVVNPDVGDVGEAFDNRDIYTKGAWMLHTLRNFIGEDAFWAGTRRLIYDTAEPWALEYPIQSRYRTTEDFIRIMSEEAGQDVAWLVETYLRETGMPALKTTRANGELLLEWSVPGGRPFPMPVSVSVDGEITVVEISNEAGTLAVHDAARVIIDPDSKILRDLPIIGDCSEQTDTQINNNIERFTEMAKEYGWRRD